MLISNIIPKEYDIWIKPSLDFLTFEGCVCINVIVHKSTSLITLHAVDLKIKTATLDEKNIKSVLSYNKSKELIIFKLKSTLKADSSHILKIEYTGEISDDMRGFYRSKYFRNGIKRYALCTQFEPTDARRAFPCWDEPVFKAKFTITLVTFSNLRVFSNMNIDVDVSQAVVAQAIDAANNVNSSTDNVNSSQSLQTVKFKQTPLMSTYLVAFVIGEFDCMMENQVMSVDTTHSHEVAISICTHPDQINHGKFALDVAGKYLRYYEQYYDITYPLEKLAMIALADFVNGAMENWGLITYCESALLLTSTSSESRKQTISTIVAHELAHQWFGNLVTMKWWDDLWLNEGFATYVSIQAQNVLFPQWDNWTHFIYEYINSALAIDSLSDSHPIEVPVETNLQINDIFDAISYNKGASIIRMLSEYIGEDKMQAGLRFYLSSHSYGSATTADLWSAIQQQMNSQLNNEINIAQIMNTWTKQAHYPLITVQLHDQTHLAITQNRFLLNDVGSANANADNNNNTTIWSIPIHILIQNDMGEVNQNNIKKTIFDQKSTLLEFEPDELQECIIKFNDRKCGFYRVKYDPLLFDRLVSNYKKLSVENQLDLLNDTFALTTACIYSIDMLYKLFDIISELPIEKLSYYLLSEISDIVGHLLIVFDHGIDHGIDINTRFLPFYQKLYTYFTFDNRPDEPELDRLARDYVLKMLNKLNDPIIIAESKRRYFMLVDNDNDVSFDDSDLNDNNDSDFDHNLIENTLIDNLTASHKFIIYSNIVKHNLIDDAYEKIKKLFKPSMLQEEKTLIIMALGKTTIVENITKHLEWVLNDQSLNQTEMSFIFTSLNWCKLTRDMSWEFLQKNWEMLKRHFNNSLHDFIGLINVAIRGYSQNADSIEKYLKNKKVLDDISKRTIEQIRLDEKLKLNCGL